MAVFQNVQSCSLVEVYRRFRGYSCPLHEGDEYSWAVVALIMEAVSASEISVKFCETTRRIVLEESHLRLVMYLQMSSDNKIGFNHIVIYHFSHKILTTNHFNIIKSECRTFRILFTVSGICMRCAARCVLPQLIMFVQVCLRETVINISIF
jgi:hypothetical protein